jgi:hypothetical protein
MPGFSPLSGEFSDFREISHPLAPGQRIGGYAIVIKSLAGQAGYWKHPQQKFLGENHVELHEKVSGRRNLAGRYRHLKLREGHR